MDILRKELSQLYTLQNLHLEHLPYATIDKNISLAKTISSVSQGCVVITDASCDKCYIFGGSLGVILGLFSDKNFYQEDNSSDEDVIYERIHPEDLVDKRLLEYEFFKFINNLSIPEKQYWKAVCRIRMKDKDNNYILVDNTTRIISLSPAGKIWLIMCTYDLAVDLNITESIEPAFVNSHTGKISFLSLGSKRDNILSEREKEILKMIKTGLPSKLIADALNISIHTVNRHRQNIISKLSVNNSIEAIRAAESMKLI